MPHFRAGGECMNLRQDPDQMLDQMLDQMPNQVPNQVKDATQREQALDPTQSFIVQAPAGSGKTELLTQRYLRLLATVDKYPEEIIAITFTRKAANEMRNRIISALQRAAHEVEPDSTHGKRTWQLAQHALLQSEKLGWNILENPNRLRIQTIDSFCGYLSEKMPILAHLGGKLNRVKDARRDYAIAVDHLFEHLEREQVVSQAIATVLTHLDNNVILVKELLCSMLAHREQWLPYVLHARQQDDLRLQLEQTLQTIINEHLAQLANHFETADQNELLQLLRFATSVLNETDPEHSFNIWNTHDKFPTAQFENLAQWQSLRNFLLTDEGTWRRAINKKMGFPASGHTKEETKLYKEYKNRLINLIALFNNNSELEQLLEKTRCLPAPHYSEVQWQVLLALCELLPYLVAELNLVFQSNAHVDFIEISQRALQALGDLENPSDLALCLDYRIKHILLDEFQDTSVTQFRLIEMLTRGWQDHDGRTLFLVGDPMQSIYRFRAAEVGLFLQTQKQGIGQIKLIPLTLKTNFRSQTAIVDWINQTFIEMFPRDENISLGAVGYAQSVAIHPSNASQSVFLHGNVEETAEATTIVEIIKNIHSKNPHYSIAILVKARNHLARILPCLKAEKINYQAVDIEPLLQLSTIQDLTALTRALLHLNDRIAWLSILRAPWCGLMLSDLHTLGRDDNRTVWQCIIDPELHTKLSSDGLQRVQQFINVIQPHITQINRTALSILIKQIWLQLSGPLTLTEPAQLKNTEAFFNLLTEIEQTEPFIDLNLLEQKLADLYAEPEHTPHPNPPPSTGKGKVGVVQIMTIHKAKGLEFDVVILPTLEAGSAADKDKLMLWQERPSENGIVELLLTPIKAKDQAADAIYQYIKQFEKQKQEFERARLFYVAATRAKHQLHLVATLPEEEKMPTSNSFLNKIYELHKNNFKEYFVSPNKIERDINEAVGNLRRLPITFMNPHPNLPPLTQGKEQDPTPSLVYSRGRAGVGAPHHGNLPTWQSPTPRLIGTTIHLLLQKLSQRDQNQWPQLAKHPECWRILLLQAGINHTELNNARSIIEKTLKTMLTSQHAQWILDKNHTDAQSEFAISYKANNEWQDLIIDRTFIDKGIRWIIDYKTSQPIDGQDLKDFLGQEQFTYRLQLETYSKAFQDRPEPIKLALYFPLIDELLIG
ncbi:MAG: DNA helicase UvrD [Gammaproteobacteria bacterium]|nr:DNA helicase UvrD [Gammaproteobacteria bacterium]